MIESTMIESTMIESTMIDSTILLIYLQRQIPLMKGLPRTYSFSTNVPDCHRPTEHHFERKRSYCSSHRGWIWGLWDPLDAKISILYVVIKNEVISLQNYVETFNFRIHWFDIVVSTIMEVVFSRKDRFSFWILSNYERVPIVFHYDIVIRRCLLTLHSIKRASSNCRSMH